ncbi:type I restriction endonuclease [Methylomonas sp. SURF-2]|uniref:Type I restriction endonuclease n=1 Tax=Methylomonas subterranea TaxID=2952225 RepID=A0ABT1TJF2_9GAMM|nr:type I restriction endonuclease [Methylomonas sp. SURF-2]MCQ8105444.1 type I restriction endonuclease [Methylomonas sp. SURF-2]
MSQTSEKAFESYIEQMLLAKGWQAGSVKEWDKELALFPAQILNFIAATQKPLWDGMHEQHGANLQSLLIKDLVRELAIKGSLHVLRHGFKFYGKTFRLAYFKPAQGLNTEVLANYQQNRLTVTRQLPCHPGDHSTLDMLFAINGLPVATCELKNPWTGQNWRNAVQQYRNDRNPRAPLFEFKQRALVHFAADPDEVHMTTRLVGKKTFFLPFNRGSHPGEVVCGAGNPQHASGYRSGYFWEEVLEREQFLDILGNFIFIERKEEKVEDGKGGSRLLQKEAVIFPRYHQLDAIRRLVAAAQLEGPGQNYLIQHSAGSGKTNSISWLSHRLANLHDGNDRKLFDCVIVITDRQVLDRQLQDAIYQIEHAQGVVKAIDQDSKQLAAALIDGTKIVITTLQKFPFVLRGLLHTAEIDSRGEKSFAPTFSPTEQAKAWEQEIAKRRYAVIVDEAHSSQTGETARELKSILGRSSPVDRSEIDAESSLSLRERAGVRGDNQPTSSFISPHPNLLPEVEGTVLYGSGKRESGETEEPDWEDRLNQVMASRGRQPNISFFAYTATPKGKTLELFGRVGHTGKPEPFHLYSMRQAIEEGFILDVLRNYTTYKTYFKLVKAMQEDPNLPKKKAARALAKFLVLHPTNISQKIEIIVEHFRNHVKHHLGGQAKAMVVTGSRLHAVKYMQAFQAYIEQHGYHDIQPLVAFSGTLLDPETGQEYTEPGMNVDSVTGKAISEKQLPECFNSPDYQVLLVANKYQTGFDQPKLMAMYVDKRLDGVQAVQTLSRLNRMLPGKEAPFVLDFVNEAEDIYRAFKPYYDATSLQESSDPALLEQLKHDLDSMQVYYSESKKSSGYGCLLDRRRQQGCCRRAYTDVFTASCPARNRAQLHYFHLPGRCLAFMNVTLKVMVGATHSRDSQGQHRDCASLPRDCLSFAGAMRRFHER